MQYEDAISASFWSYHSSLDSLIAAIIPAPNQYSCSVLNISWSIFHFLSTAAFQITVKTPEAPTPPKASVRSSDCCLLIRIPMDGEIPPVGDSDSGPCDVAMCGKKSDTEQETELKILADSSGESSSQVSFIVQKANQGTLDVHWYFHVTQPAWKSGNTHHTLRWCQTVSENTLCLQRNKDFLMQKCN